MKSKQSLSTFLFCLALSFVPASSHAGPLSFFQKVVLGTLICTQSATSQSPTGSPTQAPVTPMALSCGELVSTYINYMVSAVAVEATMPYPGDFRFDLSRKVFHKTLLEVFFESNLIHQDSDFGMAFELDNAMAGDYLFLMKRQNSVSSAGTVFFGFFCYSDRPTSAPTASPTALTAMPTYLPTNMPTVVPTKSPTAITSNPTPPPTLPQKLSCGDRLIGDYNDQALPFDVMMPYKGILTFNATNSNFTITSLNVVFGTTPLLSDTDHDGVLTLPVSVIGDYIFTIKAASGINKKFDVTILCESENPTPAPTSNPTPAPTSNPTPAPTSDPSDFPSISPTSSTNQPSAPPSKTPTPAPTNNPTPAPTSDPSKSPSIAPSSAPTHQPSASPSKTPTPAPTNNPTPAPTSDPSKSPSIAPSSAPTHQPSASPSKTPTPAPTNNPTPAPTSDPSKSPSIAPSSAPTHQPSASPSKTPTPAPTNNPTPAPTSDPSKSPSIAPSSAPIHQRSASPSQAPQIKNTYAAFQQSSNETVTAMLIIATALFCVTICSIAGFCVYQKRSKKRMQKANAVEQYPVKRVDSKSPQEQKHGAESSSIAFPETIEILEAFEEGAVERYKSEEGRIELMAIPNPNINEVYQNDDEKENQNQDEMDPSVTQLIANEFSTGIVIMTGGGEDK